MAIKTETKIHDFRINSLSVEAYNEALANKQISEDELYLVEEELTPEQILNHINMSEQTYKVKTYTTLEQLGLSTGSETIESILIAMPVNSILQLTVGANHAKIYPTQYGMLVARKDDTSRFFAEFYPKETSDLYVCSAKIENSTFTLYNWEKKTGDTEFNEHVNDTTNPHSVTASQVGALVYNNLKSGTDLNNFRKTGIYNSLTWSNAPYFSDTNGTIAISDNRKGSVLSIYKNSVSMPAVGNYEASTTVYYTQIFFNGGADSYSGTFIREVSFRKYTSDADYSFFKGYPGDSSVNGWVSLIPTTS